MVEKTSTNQEYSVGNCGFVKLVDKLGSDLTVVNAARVSFNKRKNLVDESDEKLIKFLAKHNHWTPFSQCQVQLHIKMPILVARQYFKHQVGVTRNEVSRRYVKSDPEFFIPAEFRLAAANVKQGSSDQISPDNDKIREKFYAVCEVTKLLYNELINDYNVCPEQARAILPQAMMTEFIETGSLATYARICKLRKDKTAQKEIQEYAIAIDNLMSSLFPLSWSALRES